MNKGIDPETEIKKDIPKLRRISNGIGGALLGGSTAFMLLSNSGKVSWPMISIVAIVSFVAAYIAGNAVLTWIAKMDEYCD